MIYEMFKTRRITIYAGDHIFIGLNDGDISIYSFHDEWFLVSKGNESNSHYDWWKCDQDDQLKALLKNISLHKNK
jgi:subtilase family serine protease